MKIIVTKYPLWCTLKAMAIKVWHFSINSEKTKRLNLLFFNLGLVGQWLTRTFMAEKSESLIAFWEYVVAYTFCGNHNLRQHKYRKTVISFDQVKNWGDGDHDVNAVSTDKEINFRHNLWQNEMWSFI